MYFWRAHEQKKPGWQTFNYTLRSTESVVRKVKKRESRKTFLALFVLFGVLLASPVLSSSVTYVLISSSGTISSVLPLHAEGKYIKSSNGQLVVLRGVDQTGMLDSANGWWNPVGGGFYSGIGVWNPDAVTANLDAVKTWGCNALRLLTTISFWIFDNSSYRQHVKDIITWAGERGIYVIFCPYFVVQGPQVQLPYPPYIDSSTGANIITSKQDFINYWINVANELKSFPNVIFEIFNEPNGNATDEQDFMLTTQQWINAIRSAGASQLLVTYWGAVATNMSPGGWVSDWSSWIIQGNFSDPFGNVLYSFHLYRGSIHYFVNGTRIDAYSYDDLKRGFQMCKVDYVLNNLSKPVYVGEIGANMWNTGTELENELAFFNNSLAIFNEWGLSYTAWTWRDTATGIRHGVLQNTNYIPAPNRGGAVLIKNINSNPFVFSASDQSYLYGTSFRYTQNWDNYNESLLVSIVGAGSGWLNVFWHESLMNSNIRIDFNNGTVLNAQGYYNNESNIVSIPIAFQGGKITIRIYLH